MITVCTGWNPAGWNIYGRNFVETFNQYWPLDVKLLAYTERPNDLPRGENRSLWDIPGAQDFIRKNEKIPEHCGKKPVPGWRAKDKKKNYSFRFDAVKFSRQCIIPHHAAQDRDGILVWLDADVVTFRNIPHDLIEDCLGRADLCYLGREGYHSDIGFWAVRLNDATRPFLHELSDIYLSERIFELPQWHSAYVFDFIRQQFENNGLKTRNMTPGGTSHVWWQSPLCEYMDHLKGDTRKQVGKSLERKI